MGTYARRPAAHWTVMMNTESQPSALSKITPSTLIFKSLCLGSLYVRGLTAGMMFDVAKRFPEVANADDCELMRVVVEKSLARDPACDQLLTETELANLDQEELATIASLMCQIDEVDLPDGSDPISIYATFVKQQVTQISEQSRVLFKGIGSSFLSAGTAGRMARSYAEGVLSNRFVEKASVRASQPSALAAPPISIPIDTRPQRMEGVARDTLEANLLILRRLSDIADVASDVEVDRAAQQQKDSRNLMIAVGSLFVSVALALVTIGITYYGVREADAASADSSRQYQQMIDIQRLQLAEAQSVSSTLREQLSALQDKKRSPQTVSSKANRRITSASSASSHRSSSQAPGGIQ